MIMVNLKEKYDWVMQLCKSKGVSWFVWVWRGCGIEFCCEFGWNKKKIHTGLLLERQGDKQFQNNRKNRRFLMKSIERMLNDNAE